jgi:hypothetical protein
MSFSAPQRGHVNRCRSGATFRFAAGAGVGSSNGSIAPCGAINAKPTPNGPRKNSVAKNHPTLLRSLFSAISAATIAGNSHTNTMSRRKNSHGPRNKIGFQSSSAAST